MPISMSAVLNVVQGLNMLRLKGILLLLGSKIISQRNENAM
jgi:hypothetical protein